MTESSPIQTKLDSWILRLERAAEDDDTENAHYDADNVLCEIVTALGFPEIVVAYNEVGKWYA